MLAAAAQPTRQSSQSRLRQSFAAARVVDSTSLIASGLGGLEGPLADGPAEALGFHPGLAAGDPSSPRLRRGRRARRRVHARAACRRSSARPGSPRGMGILPMSRRAVPALIGRLTGETPVEPACPAGRLMGGTPMPRRIRHRPTSEGGVRSGQAGSRRNGRVRNHPPLALPHFRDRPFCARAK